MGIELNLRQVKDSCHLKSAGLFTFCFSLHPLPENSLGSVMLNKAFFLPVCSSGAVSMSHSVRQTHVKVC